ncbi:MAG: hypothetical protein B2I17_06735 [Thermoplasmatales archaeon B_DKE]|nr:MAG: hypothetical protein B2I17_06735 [Thermoplasmatales archaeon B_DKE]
MTSGIPTFSPYLGDLALFREGFAQSHTYWHPVQRSLTPNSLCRRDSASVFLSDTETEATSFAPVHRPVYIDLGMSAIHLQGPIDPVVFLHCLRFADIHVPQPHFIPFPTEPCYVPERMAEDDRVFLYHYLPIVLVPDYTELPVIGIALLSSPLLKILNNVLFVFSLIFLSLLFFPHFWYYCTEMSD